MSKTSKKRNINLSDIPILGNTNKKENYDNVPVSQKTLDGMSLNSNDRQYLQRMFCLQDEVTYQFISETYDKHAKIICDVVREMLEEHKKEIFVELNEVKKGIEDLKNEIKSINFEIENIRGTIRYHDKRINHIEKILEIEK